MENSIKRDIHLLESYAGMTHKMNDNQGRPKLDQAIEHILLDYKRVLKENEDLKEIEENHRKENGELRKQFKELEEDLTSVYLKGIYDERDKWKSLVEDKIEELNKKVKDYQCIGNRIYQIKVLQELIKESEE